MRIGSLADAMRYSTTGMTAERFRMDTISSNLANANSVARPGEEGYRRRAVVLTASEGGVRIDGVEKDMERDFQMKYEPGHPFADAKGMVTMSNIDPISEMVDMIGASRAYEANIAAFNSAKGMMNSALQIGKA
ncbi:MAG: flagellar basal body rod protein FlgC [Fimbriimonas sp.]|nr:flagellar basal body rod protein FlgC [Fimbriimonas sp.]